jgi:hypothetical protein
MLKHFLPWLLGGFDAARLFSCSGLDVELRAAGIWRSGNGTICRAMPGYARCHYIHSESSAANNPIRD